MNITSQGLVLFCCIVDFGKGSKLLKISKELGSLASTIFLGRGTVNDDLLKVLGIFETRREILITIADKAQEEALYQQVRRRLSLDKANMGIAFSIPMKYYMAEGKKSITKEKREEVEILDYEAIFVIVDKGSMEPVLEAAEAAGSTGGTIIHGRGAGSKKKELLFHFEIEPEKDIVLILSKTKDTVAIVDSIKAKLNLSEPGRGIIFVMDVSRTVGLYES